MAGTLSIAQTHKFQTKSSGCSLILEVNTPLSAALMIANVKSPEQSNLHNVQIESFFPSRFSLSLPLSVSLRFRRTDERRKKKGGGGRKKLLFENDGTFDAANRLNAKLCIDLSFMGGERERIAAPGTVKIAHTFNLI